MRARTQLRILPGGDCGTFAEMPGWKDLPRARGPIIYLNDLSPDEAARLKTMIPAERRALAKRQAERRAVRP
jgi:hypothetical protein